MKGIHSVAGADFWIARDQVANGLYDMAGNVWKLDQ